MARMLAWRYVDKQTKKMHWVWVMPMRIDDFVYFLSCLLAACQYMCQVGAISNHALQSDVQGMVVQNMREHFKTSTSKKHVTCGVFLSRVHLAIGVTSSIITFHLISWRTASTTLESPGLMSKSSKIPRTTSLGGATWHGCTVEAM